MVLSDGFSLSVARVDIINKPWSKVRSTLSIYGYQTVWIEKKRLNVLKSFILE